MNWNPPLIWKGGTCWIIGGGPSVATQFHIPKKIVDGVRANKLPISAYSPYMSMLHDKHVIGINGAFRLGEWVDICFFGDKNWYFDNIKDLKDYKGMVVGCASFLELPGFQKLGVPCLPKSLKQTYGICTEKGKVAWNLNSGAAAISLAYQAGCKRIVLLGFDMALAPDGTGHWHNLYNGKQNMPFAKHLVGFEQIARDAERLEIEIINASPKSTIPYFPKKRLSEIL